MEVHYLSHNSNRWTNLVTALPDLVVWTQALGHQCKWAWKVDIIIIQDLFKIHFRAKGGHTPTAMGFVGNCVTFWQQSWVRSTPQRQKSADRLTLKTMALKRAVQGSDYWPTYGCQWIQLQHLYHQRLILSIMYMMLPVKPLTDDQQRSNTADRRKYMAIIMAITHLLIKEANQQLNITAAKSK